MVICLEVMKDIDDGSIDMILCDLPFGNNKNSLQVGYHNSLLNSDLETV